MLSDVEQGDPFSSQLKPANHPKPRLNTIIPETTATHPTTEHHKKIEIPRKKKKEESDRKVRKTVTTICRSTIEASSTHSSTKAINYSRSHKRKETRKNRNVPLSSSPFQATQPKPPTKSNRKLSLPATRNEDIADELLMPNPLSQAEPRTTGQTAGSPQNSRSPQREPPSATSKSVGAPNLTTPSLLRHYPEPHSGPSHQHHCPYLTGVSSTHQPSSLPLQTPSQHPLSLPPSINLKEALVCSLLVELQKTKRRSEAWSTSHSHFQSIRRKVKR